jgi:hypothetical protein
LYTPDPAGASSTDEDLPTQMIDREALLRSGAPPQSPPSAPASLPVSLPERPEVSTVTQGWSRPIALPSPPRVAWQNSPTPAIDTMVASSELMMEREAAQAAAPPAPPPRFQPAPTFQPVHPSSTDTLSTVPFFRLAKPPEFDASRTPLPLPLAWEPAPTHDRARVALIVAVVVIVISLVLLLILMLTQ